MFIYICICVYIYTCMSVYIMYIPICVCIHIYTQNNDECSKEKKTTCKENKK